MTEPTNSATQNTKIPANQNPERIRRFLVVADGSEESLVAMRYAARRAHNTGGRLTVLAIIKPAEFQHWNTVAEAMRAEAFEEAEDLLDRTVLRLKADCGVIPDTIIKEGKGPEVLMALLKEDPSISLLVLGAATGTEGPGPLVTQLGHQQAGSIPIPVTIVPGSMTDETMRAVT